MSRPVLPWHSPLTRLPPFGTIVWVRRLPWYDVPILCQWRDDSQFYPGSLDSTGTWLEGVPLDGAPGGPLYGILLTPNQVHSWKYRYLADVPTGYVA